MVDGGAAVVPASRIRGAPESLKVLVFSYSSSFSLSFFAAGNGMMKIDDGAVLAMIDGIPLVKGRGTALLSLCCAVLHDIHDATGILCTSLLLQRCIVEFQVCFSLTFSKNNFFS